MPNYSPVRNNTETRNNISSNMERRFGTESGRLDSMTKILSDIVAQEVTGVNRETRAYLSSLDPTNATGEDLDFLASQMYSFQRRGSSVAYSNFSERNIYFYTAELNFGTINNGNDIFLPAGTRIGTSQDLDSTTALVFETVEDYTLRATERVGYCGVRAVSSGSKYNVGARSLIFHNVTTYTSFANSSLAVSNAYPILNGSDRESDESLRYRILNYMASAKEKNVTALRLASLNVPGVTNIEVIPSYFGIGSSAIVVFGAEKESNSNLLELTQRRVQSLLGNNTRVKVIEGIYVYLDFDITVYISEKTNVNDRVEIERRIKETIRNYTLNSNRTRRVDFRDIEVGMRKLVSQEKIVGFGSLDESRSIFDHIYVRKTDLSLDNNEGRKELLSNNLSVDLDERIKIGDINIRFEVNRLWLVS